MRRAVALLGLLTLSTFDVVASSALAENACEREMRGASAKYDVPIGVLYAVGLTESGRKDSLQPFAMNIEGRAYFAASADDALREFELAKEAGAKLIDIGCMQINHYFHSEEFPSVAAMFEPRRNVTLKYRFRTSGTVWVR
jgi:hypothetical protein